MNTEIIALSATAATLGVIHTLAGPDHYLPFIVMSKARNWSVSRTLWITVLCGLGHVGSSVLIGIAGIAFGLGVARLDIFESIRGNVAGWLFILFGLGYLVYGLARETGHRHAHEHGRKHFHFPGRKHTHNHEETRQVRMTPWILFTIFVFGPCEPLIPLLMYPAAKFSVAATVTVALIFSFCTIATMAGMVLFISSGYKLVPMKFLDRYMHTIAGATILFCGISIQFLGL